jgi:hypothetical protein
MAGPTDSHGALDCRLDQLVGVFWVFEREWRGRVDNISGAFNSVTKRLGIKQISLDDFELIKERVTDGLPDRLDFGLVLAPDSASYSKATILEEVSKNVKTNEA